MFLGFMIKDIFPKWGSIHFCDRNEFKKNFLFYLKFHSKSKTARTGLKTLLARFFLSWIKINWNKMWTLILSSQTKLLCVNKMYEPKIWIFIIFQKYILRSPLFQLDCKLFKITHVCQQNPSLWWNQQLASLPSRPCFQLELYRDPHNMHAFAVGLSNCAHSEMKAHWWDRT